MQTWPQLDVVIPFHPRDGRSLERLLASIASQTYPTEQLRIHVITQGNSEEAKAFGIQASDGEIVGLFCADNDLPDKQFLQTMVAAASRPEVVGAYTALYHYDASDTLLTRYFSLLGANDPLCHFLGKADRADYRHVASIDPIRIQTFNESLPSLGDNGCFYKRHVLHSLIQCPDLFGSCMCLCKDLYTQGYATWAIVGTTALWHRTGDSFWRYLRNRWHYTNDLYWHKRCIRRWHLVATYRDWALVCLFALTSLLVVPQLLLSLRGYRQVRDCAWFLHPPICFALTWLYTCSALMWLWSVVRSTARKRWSSAWSRFGTHRYRRNGLSSENVGH